MQHMIVNIKEVRAHFADYIARAEQGEEIVITRNGKVVARLLPPAPCAALDPDRLATRRNQLHTPNDIPNLVLLARQDARY
jgi:prevent-host-death family protein